MSTYRDIVEIILVRENELGQRTEWHFPILAELEDKAVATVYTEVLEGRDFPMGGEFSFVERDRLHAIKLEVLADIGRNRDRKKSDVPPMYWMHSLYLEDGEDE